MKRYIRGLGWTLCLLLVVSVCYFGFRGQAFAEGETPAEGQSLVGLETGESWAKNWDAAGVYGPSEGLQTVSGQTTISAAGVELQNMVINGDLYLQSTIGSGTVMLRNVTVTGELTVLGGGNLTIVNGQVNRLLVNNPGQAVTIAAEGTAAIWSVRVQSECQLEEKTGEEATGFGHVYSTTAETLSLSGNFPTLTVENVSGAVNFLSGKIGKVYMESQANDSVLTLGAQAEIEVIDLVSAVRIKGTGTINKAVVLAEGSELDMDAKEYQFAAGKSVLVTGGIVDVEGKHVVTLQDLADVTLAPGKSTSKTVVVEPTDAQVTVTSSNTSAATATLNGSTISLKALAAGKATITVTAVKEGFSTAKETFTVTVSAPALPKVTVQGLSGITLAKGKSATKTVTANPADATLKVTSSNPGVAAASLSGKTITVSAKAAGTTTITVTAAKAGHTSARATFKVTVPAPQAPPPPAAKVEAVVEKAENSPVIGSTSIRVRLKNTNTPEKYNVTLAGQKMTNRGSYFELAVPANDSLAKKSTAELKALVKF